MAGVRQIYIRLTDDEIRFLDKRAREQGISRAELMRRIIMEYRNSVN